VREAVAVSSEPPASVDAPSGTSFGRRVPNEEHSRFAQGRLAAVLALLFAPFVAFPPDFIPKALLDGGDDLLANLPELLYSGKKLLEGELFWTPALWMGHPLWGEPEFATFYLPKLLLLVGSPVVAYASYLVLHYLAAEFGAYLYLKSLGIGRLGSVFGALAFAYAGFMLGHRAHTMYVSAGAWAPFVLLAFDRAEERGGSLSYLVAAVAFAMVPFSGAVQLTVYLASTILLLALARSVFERNPRPILSAVTGLAPATLVSALQLVPSFYFSRQLATDLRADYTLDVMHSFHPVLLPTLGLPLPPIEGEIYSRAGIVVSCAVVVALVGIRTAPSRIRAWAVVAAVALVLMLGRYFPPLARLLHGLPIVGVLRGPARHNFELALALSVLGAYGLEVARHSGAGPIARWLFGGALFSALVWGMVRLAATGHVADDQAVNLIYGVGQTAAVGASLAFALWLSALAGRDALGALLLWGCVAVAPVLETAWAMRVENWHNKSALDVIETARATLPEPGRFVRLLSVSLHRGSVDALAGNSVLFHPGVESLQGYSSIAYTDARQILDLDMHGQASSYDELALSILPSVFGVTHVVLPHLACGEVRLTLTPEHDLCVRSSAHVPVDVATTQGGVPVASGELGCTGLVTDTTWRYRLETSLRTSSAPDALSGSASFLFLRPPLWDRRVGVDVTGSRLGPVPTRAAQSVRLADLESWGGFGLFNRIGTSVEFSDPGLVEERDVTVARLGPWLPSDFHVEHAEVLADFLRLSPDGKSPAKIERRVLWPKDVRGASALASLEVEARTSGTAPEDLVVDLYADPGFDSTAAQIVVPGSELGAGFKVFRKDVRVDGAPDRFLLRAFAMGGDPIEIREARLSAQKQGNVIRYPITTNRYPRGASVRDGKVLLEPNRALSDGVHLPVRAFDIVLDAEAPARLSGPVEFGLVTPTPYDEPRAWKIAPEVFTSKPGVRLHHIAVSAPDVREPRLFVRVSGTNPLRVKELSATDACALRDYKNPHSLANGLSLYENPRAAPRAYTVSETVRRNDLAGVRAALLDFAPADVGTRAVVMNDLPSDLGTGTVEQARFGDRSTDLIVESPERPTLLVVNERFDPDFRASIDGAAVAMFPVNGLVRGVVVPKGRHRVHMEYRVPNAIWLAVGLAVAGVLAALVVAPQLSRYLRLGRKSDGQRRPVRGELA
jgi:hypothetical protein